MYKSFLRYTNNSIISIRKKIHCWAKVSTQGNAINRHASLQSTSGFERQENHGSIIVPHTIMQQDFKKTIALHCTP